MDSQHRRAPSQGNEPTVLIVEDDPICRLDMAEELRGRGVAVIEAADAQQAIRKLEAGRRIDLVFSDVQMPGPMDGFSLAAWIWLRRPSVKVILTSAYYQGRSGAELDRATAFVGKPYQVDRVASQILEELTPAP